MTAVSLIVAAAENHVIGRGGTLPWHLPDDLRWFRRTTMGSTLIMGRRTYESHGKPLPGRRSIVLTRQSDWKPPGDPEAVRKRVRVAPSLEEAFALCREEDHVFVIGGEEVFRAVLPRADRIYLTRVHAEVEGDTRFPHLDPANWTLTSQERHCADDRHEFPFSFEVYERRRAEAGPTAGAAP